MEKLAFGTQYGRCEFLVLPFGICIVLPAFQIVMNIFSAHVSNFYILRSPNDVLVCRNVGKAHFKLRNFLGNNEESLNMGERSQI